MRECAELASACKDIELLRSNLNAALLENGKLRADLVAADANAKNLEIERETLKSDLAESASALARVDRVLRAVADAIPAEDRCAAQTVADVVRGIISAREKLAAQWRDYRQCSCGFAWRPVVGLYGTTEESACPACALRSSLAAADERFTAADRERAQQRGQLDCERTHVRLSVGNMLLEIPRVLSNESAGALVRRLEEQLQKLARSIPVSAQVAENDEASNTRSCDASAPSYVTRAELIAACKRVAHVSAEYGNVPRYQSLAALADELERA